MSKNYGDPASTRPYQCFMGRWEGLCKTFDDKGIFLEAAAVHMDVYWIDENTWRLHEDFEKLYGYGPAVYHTDISVDGKFCYGGNDMVQLHGTELTPYNYVFTIESAISMSTVYNNHYFIDPNNRRIITHKVRDGKTLIFQIQDFVRVA